MDFYTNVCRTRDKILVKGYKGGKPIKKSVSYRPNHYILSKKSDTPYKTLDGRSLDVVNLDTMGGARKFREKYSGIDGFEIHGYDRYVYTYIADSWPGDVEYDNSIVRMASLDIECESENGFPDPMRADEVVNAITIKPFGGRPQVFGIGPWETDLDVDYYNCFNEANLLTEFTRYWRSAQFDIITGWNVDQFDITYLCNRIDRILGEGEHKRLSPWNQTSVREFRNNFGQMTMVYDLFGLNVLDYMELYKKHTFVNQQSYKLEHIAQVELGHGKVDYSDFGSLHSLYKEDYGLYLEYNVKDAALIEELEDKLGYIELTQTMAYNAKCNYSDVFGMVKYWETIIYNFLNDQGIQTPPQKLSRGDDKTRPIMGAYVKEPIVGGHKWVVSFDLNSLYPHLIMQYNISPETMMSGVRESCNVDKLLNRSFDTSSIQNRDVSLTPNGVTFRRDKQGFLPELMETFYDERKMWKKKMIEYQKEREKTTAVNRLRELDTLIKRAYNNQQVRKIALNSAYGALANQWFAFFSIDLAEAITSSGQLVIKWAEQTINSYLNSVLKTDDEDYVIAMDTDSLYITFDKLVAQIFPEDTPKEKIVDFLDNVGQTKIEEVLAAGFDDLAGYTNAYRQKMEMGREAIADFGIWTAKKRYILNVWDNEGVRLATPKLKMMGIETAKSSTPTWVRDKLTEALKVIMRGDEHELWSFVADAKTEWKTLPVEEVAFPRGVSMVTKYMDKTTMYTGGTPIHVRGSILYNHHLELMGLTKKYEPIKNGDKIKFVYLKLPNLMKENVIAFPMVLPKEFDIQSVINYDLQFEKAFVEPLKTIVNSINWNVEQVASLDSFFN